MKQIILDENRIISLPEKHILTYIPFKGKEKKCWDCGGDRQLMFVQGLDGSILFFDEVCENPALRVEALLVEEEA